MRTYVRFNEGENGKERKMSEIYIPVEGECMVVLASIDKL